MATVVSARSNYRNVATVPEAVTGRLLALSNVEFHILTPGADPAISASHISVFGSRNPADLAPLAQPIVTDATGIINFWAEPGEYDIFVHDRNAPARIADQRFGWSSLSPVDKGIPAAKIRDDAALDLNALSAVIMRQIAPLGAVLDWWRPVSTYDAGAGAGNPPPGYAVCDGSTIASANHDFGTGGSITLPDLRNKFIIGADIGVGDANAGTTTTSPGIRGAGGAHARSIQHSHNVNGSVASHSHRHISPLGMIGTAISVVAPSDGALDWSTSSYSFMDTAASGSFTGGQTVQISERHIVNSESVSPTFSGASDLQLSTAQDFRPAYVGLLKIMKIRRS